MICSAAYAMSLSCSWCDRPQCGRDRRRLRPFTLANRQWCDVMHVLHSFGLGQLRLPLAAVAVLIALDALARFGDKRCETCLGGLARSAEKPSVQLCSSILHVPSLELRSLPSLASGSCFNSTVLTPHRAPLLLSSGPLLPRGVVIGCHQPPRDKLAGWQLVCVCSSARPQSLAEPICQGRPCTPVVSRNLTLDF